jgi:hypothetical protein
MPVYRYVATANEPEPIRESGTVLARNEEKARDKLTAIGLSECSFRELRGLKGLLCRLFPDIR